MTFKLEEHTGVLIKKAARLFERVSNINLDELGITYAQTIFLVRLWEKDGQNQMDLTRSAGLKQPTVVGILNKMERDGLLTRVRNEQDKRIYNFYLTDKARTACEKLEEHGDAMKDISVGTMEQSSIGQLNKSLLQVIDNLQKFIDSRKDLQI